MSAVRSFEPGGYRYIRGPFQYSAGIAADPGYTLERVRFATPVPLAAGFERIAAHLVSRGRPLTAFAACELRSPAPFSDQGFRDFNRAYVGTLERWGIFHAEENPVARSNVCPELRKPDGPSFHAFTYTVPAADADAMPAFVIAGSGEAREGPGTYGERTVRLGDTSAEGLREKARFVLDAMEQRMAALGFTWRDTLASQAYTVFDLHPFLADEIGRRDAAAHGLTWHHARPPVVGLDYEMDVRAVPAEFAIAARAGG